MKIFGKREAEIRVRCASMSLKAIVAGSPCL